MEAHGLVQPPRLPIISRSCVTQTPNGQSGNADEFAVTDTHVRYHDELVSPDELVFRPRRPQRIVDDDDPDYSPPSSSKSKPYSALKSGVVAPARLKMMPCRYCGKQFQGSNKLGRHERTHTGERPFECDVCNKAFARKEYLKYHLREVHKIDNELTQIRSRRHTATVDDRTTPRFECDVCEKNFRDTYHLERHRANAHGMAQFDDDTTASKPTCGPAVDDDAHGRRSTGSAQGTKHVEQVPSPSAFTLQTASNGPSSILVRTEVHQDDPYLRQLALQTAQYNTATIHPSFFHQ
jgi:hypothetical protein